MKNYRSISPQLLEELKNGKLKFMVEWAKKYSERLSLCFRGAGEPERVILYDRSNVFLRGYISGNIPVIEVSGGHIKPDKNKEDNTVEKVNDFLSVFGFNSTNGGKIFTKKITDELDVGYLTSLYHYLEDMMDYYFRYYADKNRPFTEKRRQQEIFAAHKKNTDGYFIFDMEYTPPHKSKKEKDNDENDNRTDMLALKFCDSMPLTLSFIELKSTGNACEGKNGIKAHLTKMCGAIDSNPDFVRERTEDAYKIIAQYSELGLYDLPEAMKSARKDIPMEVIIYLTDGAVDYWKKKRHTISTPNGWCCTDREKDDGEIIVTYTRMDDKS